MRGQVHWVQQAEAVQHPFYLLQCNGVYKILLTKILSGYFFAGTRTSGGYPTPVYRMLLNIATQLELQKAAHGAKLELLDLEATLVALESYKRCCTVALRLELYRRCSGQTLARGMDRTVKAGMAETGAAI